MIGKLSTHILTTTTLSLVIILFYATFIGRMMALCFPSDLRQAIRFYLAPAFGLALTLIFIAVFGRYRPFGDSPLFILLVMIMTGLAIATEKNKAEAFRHGLTIAIFGLFSCFSLLSALYYAGALNPHNDTFTYIAQGDWLQTSPFRALLTDENVTPAATQIALYQHEGFRMGGTYLLGLFQSLLNIRWAFDIYPAIVCASVAASCLVIGYPAARAVVAWPAWARLAPLVIIGNSLGGLSFAAHFGFMPQGFGLLFGAAFLFCYGRIIPLIAEGTLTNSQILALSFPLALLFASSVFSYSEIAPFLVLSAVLATIVASVSYRVIKPFLLIATATLVLCILFLNIEIIRSYRALHIQSAAVVGSPIDWPLIGYIAHAFGLHGGGWDTKQWSIGGVDWVKDAPYLIALALLFLLFLVSVVLSWRSVSLITLLPTFFIVILFAAGLIYFRYFVRNPFPVGTGQSWSQFKLSDWSQIFVSAILLCFILPLAARTRFSKILFAAGALLSLVFATQISADRSGVIITYYPKPNLSAHLRELRDTVLNVCRTKGEFYLDLEGNDHKYRQLISVYLADRHLKSNWHDDGYVEMSLPAKWRNEPLKPDDCIIEPAVQTPGASGTVLGLVRIRSGIDPNGEIGIRLAESVNAKETSPTDWWVWVSRKASFTVQTRAVTNASTKAQLTFGIAAAQAQNITVSLEGSNGTERQIIAVPAGESQYTLPISMEARDLRTIVFTSDAEPQRLSPRDARTANFMLRNLQAKIE
jgi:hypothetical protein